MGDETQKGYDLASLGPVFKRYLTTHELSVTSVTEPSVTHVTDTNGMGGDASACDADLEELEERRAIEAEPAA
jgi:hypothetical protein